jgi:hypothetical protein
MTLLCVPDSTLLDIQTLLTDKDFRNSLLANVTGQHILSFWHNEFDKYSPSLKSEAITPILNKTGLFLTSTPLRNIVGQKTTNFKMQQVMDEGKILIANLSKGKIGEEASSLLGSIIVNSIQLAVLYRGGQKEHNRKPFFLFVDEIQSFISLSFADILSEARKFGLSLFLAHQYIDQLHEKIRSAIFGNVGTIISFRIGATDAEYLAKEFYPEFGVYDLINLPKYSMYLKLMIDGATSKSFSATTNPLKEKGESYKNEIISVSQRKYGRKREEVEQGVPSKQSISQNEGNGQQMLL